MEAVDKANVNNPTNRLLTEYGLKSEHSSKRITTSNVRETKTEVK